MSTNISLNTFFVSLFIIILAQIRKIRLTIRNIRFIIQKSGLIRIIKLSEKNPSEKYKTKQGIILMTTTVKTEIIIDYRKANNLTVEEFCKKCNISKQVYYKLMKSNLNFRAEALYNIGKNTNLLSNDLLIIED